MTTALPLVVLAGVAGTGKTTLGAELARLIRGSLVDLDDLTAPDVPREHRYAALEAVALERLREGRAVVAAAPWTRELQDLAWYAALQQQAAAAGGHVLVIWLHGASATLRRRLTARGLGRDHAKLAAWSTWSEGVQLTPLVPHVAVDTTALPQGTPT